MMKLILILLFMFVVSVATAKPEWKEIKKKHFVICYSDSSEFAQRVGREAEKYYKTISSDLGFTRHDGFWLWDKRAKIYIYNSRADFVRASGAPHWAAGKANVAQRLIATFQGGKGFIDSVLPYEMTHLIFMCGLEYSSISFDHLPAVALG